MTNAHKSRLRTSKRMSNTGYHQNGKPRWWARTEDGWLNIPFTRGDEYLDCAVDLAPGTEVRCGAGKGRYKTVRETVVTVALED